MSETLSADTFRPCEGQSFRLPVDGGDEIELKLDEVRALKGDTPRKDKSPFSLLFRGPSGLHFEQQIVPLANETIGRIELFLVPLGSDPDDEKGSTLFEAIFT